MGWNLLRNRRLSVCMFAAAVITLVLSCIPNYRFFLLIRVAYLRWVCSSDKMLPVNKMPPIVYLCLCETTCVLQIDDTFTHEVGFLILGVWCAIKSGPSDLYQRWWVGEDRQSLCAGPICEPMKYQSYPFSSVGMFICIEACERYLIYTWIHLPQKLSRGYFCMIKYNCKATVYLIILHMIKSV